jgi:HEAT repeat protein
LYSSDPIDQLQMSLRTRRSALDRLRAKVWNGLPDSLVNTLRLSPPTDVEVIRRAACAELASMGPAASNAVAGLVQTLEDPSIPVRMAAIEALSSIGPPASDAIPALIKHRRDNPPEVRRKVLETLGRVGPESGAVFEAIVGAIPDDDANVGAAALLTLGRMTAARSKAVPIILSILREPTNSLWHAALEASCQIGPDDPQVVSTLVEMVRAGDSYPCEASIRALGRFGRGAAIAVPVLKGRLGDRNARVRLEAARAVWEIENDVRSVLPVVMAALNDGTDPFVQLGSDQLLGTMRNDAALAVPGLIEIFKQQQQPQPVTAAQTGNSIPAFARRAGPPAHWLAERHRQISGALQLGIVKALGEIGPGAAESVPILIATLQDPEPTLAREAARALGKVGPVTLEVVAALLDVLKNRNSLASDAAAEALGTIGPGAKEAIPLLVEAKNDMNRRRQVFVRPAATQALTRIAPNAAAQSAMKD